MPIRSRMEIAWCCSNAIGGSLLIDRAGQDALGAVANLGRRRLLSALRKAGAADSPKLRNLRSARSRTKYLELSRSAIQPAILSASASRTG